MTFGNQFNQPWTDDEKQLVTTRWTAGASAREISGELTGRSRNAVIGLITRLGLVRAPQGPAPNKTRKNPPPPRPERPNRMVKIRPVGLGPINGLKTSVVIIDDLETPPVSDGVTLEQLTNTTCRWPIDLPGADDFRYCGAHADLTGKRPYCAAHTRTAWQPPQPRQKRTAR